MEIYFYVYFDFVFSDLLYMTGGGSLRLLAKDSEHAMALASFVLGYEKVHIKAVKRAYD